MGAATDRATTDENQDAIWSVLGGLRFVLAAGVFATHLRVAWTRPGLVVALFSGVGNSSAVIGFLIISGYSIAHSIDRRPHGFLRRRLLRIYPTYLLAIAVSLVPFVHRTEIPTQGQVFHATSLADLALNLAFVGGLIGHQLSTDPVVWSLAIEVALYGCAPLLNRIWDGWLWILIAASGTAYAMYTSLNLPQFAWLPYGSGLLFLSWPWLAGFIYFRRRSHAWAKALLIGSVMLIGWQTQAYEATGHRPVLVVTAAAVCWGGILPLHRWVRASLNFAGDVSYPLYLLHVPVLLSMWVFVGPNVPVALVIATATAVSILALGFDLAVRRMIRANAGRRIAVDVTPTPT